MNEESARARHFIELFGGVSRRVRALMAEAYADLGMGTTQAKFLRHIGDDAGISQADLSRATDTAPALTGRAIETLVDKGWVRRKQNEQDRRQYLVELTAAGRAMREEVESARTRIAARLGDVLEADDFDDFERIAGKLMTALGPPDGD